LKDQLRAGKEAAAGGVKYKKNKIKLNKPNFKENK
jgi:hypothetical protein